jgi:hypothetical protein
MFTRHPLAPVGRERQQRGDEDGTNSNVLHADIDFLRLPQRGKRQRRTYGNPI